MVRVFNKSIMIAFAICAGVSGLASIPARAQESSFQSSCRGISIAGATLTATCRRVDGTFARTSIVLRGIANINGRLQQTAPEEPATFQDSCQHIHVIGGTLTATCRKVDGAYIETSILIPNIENINGNLQFTQ
jgi:hypothetical protein